MVLRAKIVSKILEVNNCSECKYFKYWYSKEEKIEGIDFSTGHYYCKEMKKEVYMYEIPEWCPLPEKD